MSRCKLAPSACFSLAKDTAQVYHCPSKASSQSIVNRSKLSWLIWILSKFQTGSELLPSSPIYLQTTSMLLLSLLQMGGSLNMMSGL